MLLQCHRANLANNVSNTVQCDAVGGASSTTGTVGIVCFPGRRWSDEAAGGLGALHSDQHRFLFRPQAVNLC